MSESEIGCCPRFDLAPWEDQIIEWEAKPFVRDTVRCQFHIPLNFGGVMMRSMEFIEAAGVKDSRSSYFRMNVRCENRGFTFPWPINYPARTTYN